MSGQSETVMKFYSTARILACRSFFDPKLQFDSANNKHIAAILGNKINYDKLMLKPRTLNIKLLSRVIHKQMYK